MGNGSESATQAAPGNVRAHGHLIYRQSGWTRFTHWIWAISLFFLLLSGLQIFNAHPTLYLGDQSGFGFDNEVFAISGFPAWATIPSGQDLATGRVAHFFFAWILSGTLLVWLVAGLVNGHIRRDLAPGIADLRRLPHDVLDHLKLKFHHARDYNTLQKLAYAGVLFVAFPLMIATGLAMSPSMNAAIPFLADMLGGRQTARTIHFVVMLLLVGFFLIHMLMIVAAGPINELRSIVTGWYRVDAKPDSTRRSG